MQTTALKFATPLEHPPGYSVSITVPKVGTFDVVIPKDHDENMLWRKQLLAEARFNPTRQASLRALCSQPCVESFLFWLNAFGWTYLQNVIEADGSEHAITDGGVDELFITWPDQDKIAGDAIRCVLTGKNAVVDKARGYGVTWLIVAAFVWMMLYLPGVNFMVMSRVEELVDNAEDPDSLFWKIDYLIDKLPAWLKPAMRRTRLKIANLDLKSTIVGKSTTDQQGRAGRKTAVFLDEAAMMKGLKSIWTSMRYTTKCIIANSTPLGPGFFAELVRSPKVHQLVAAWWNHPKMGRGRYESVESDGSVRIRSPWYDLQCSLAVDAMEIAQELDRDHQGAGYIVFPTKVIAVAREECQPAYYVGDIQLDEGKDEVLTLRRREYRSIWFNDSAAEERWKLWIEPEEDPNGLWRPPQNRTYCSGIDISWGTGKSNSSMVVKCVETGEIVGVATAANMNPAEWMAYCVRCSYWWGGTRGQTFMTWESNFGGGMLTREVIRHGHTWNYYPIDERSRKRPQSDKPGWTNSQQALADLCGLLIKAMKQRQVLVRDELILNEASQYIWYDEGGLGPANLSYESSAASATHGDRVIGTGLAHLGSLYCNRCTAPERPAPVGSMAERLQDEAKKRKRDRSRRRAA